MAGLPDSSLLAPKSLIITLTVDGDEVTLVKLMFTICDLPAAIVRSVLTGETRNPLPPLPGVEGPIANADFAGIKSSVDINSRDANLDLMDIIFAYLLCTNILSELFTLYNQSSKVCQTDIGNSAYIYTCTLGISNICNIAYCINANIIHGGV